MSNSKDNLELFTEIEDFLFHLFEFFQVNSLTGTSTLCEPKSEDFMEIRQVKILLLQEVEEESSCKVAERHQVADGFHDVPAVVFERACKNYVELSNH